MLIPCIISIITVELPFFFFFPIFAKNIECTHTEVYLRKSFIISFCQLTLSSNTSSIFQNNTISGIYSRAKLYPMCQTFSCSTGVLLQRRLFFLFFFFSPQSTADHQIQSLQMKDQKLVLSSIDYYYTILTFRVI